MNKIEELNKSQQIELSNDFNDCLNKGIIFNPPEVPALSELYFMPMSATVVVHNWNHSRFLLMLFQSFLAMDRENIDVDFIITDSGSDKPNVDLIKYILREYKSKLKITFLYHDLDIYREKFNNNNPDGTFHGFPYISNSALLFINKDIHIICDSSNIVNKNWLRALCSPHYTFHKERIILKCKGADFTAESTVSLIDKDFKEEYFTLPHTYYGFQAGRGFGWSLKTNNLKALGGFRHLFSSCGGVDDDLWYRAKLEGFKFFGHKEGFSVHRIHNEGYEKNPRKPNWAYKQLKELYITQNITQPFIKFEHIDPIYTLKNYAD
jgi:hypothetical protein